MFSAVLFDLDGTLLDIDLEPFLRDYFGLLGPVIAELWDAGTPADALTAVIAGTEAMSRPHPGRMNRDVFDEVFFEHTGVSLADGEAAERVTRFYAEAFPTLKGTRGPRPGGAAAVAAAKALGMRAVLATNPIFPLDAIRERARWAGLDLEDFEFVTTYENSEACKPHAAYYRGIARALSVDPRECLMVGDDPILDLSAADVGMSTFYVGPAQRVISDWSGDLVDLAALLARLNSD